MPISTTFLRTTGASSVTALLSMDWWVVLAVAALPTLHMVIDRATTIWLVRAADRTALSGKDVARIVGAAHRGVRAKSRSSGTASSSH